MGRPGGNPNIREISKLSTGPRTEVGKLKNSVVRVTTGQQISPDSRASRAVGYDGTKGKLQAYHNFVSFILGHPIKTLSEIERMEGLLAVMQTNLMDIIQKQEEGKGTTDKDRKDMYLMKDTLVELHKLKYGEKKVNINTSYKDIRDLMFEE